MYIMFPIAWMYYFGVNLDTRFSVPDFWPKPEETHKIPFEKDEQVDLLKQLKDARLERRRRRIDAEEKVALVNGAVGSGGEEVEGVLGKAQAQGLGKDRDFGVGSIERWARGR